MKNAKNVFETIAGKVAGVFAGAENSQYGRPAVNKKLAEELEFWGRPAVNGKFVGELVRELTAQGFTHRSSALFTRRVVGIKLDGVSRTFTRPTDRLSWEELTVYAGGNKLDSSTLLIYFGIIANTGSRRYFGIPELSIGVSRPSNEWSYIGTTPIRFNYVGMEPLNSIQYAPGISAKAALAKAGLKGLEAKV